MMHLISEIPDPAAYFASCFTRCAATNEKSACPGLSIRVITGKEGGTYSEEHVYSPPRGHDIAPLVPGLAGVLVAALDLPAAELLVQPPAVRAVAHLDVRQPFRHNGDEGSVEANRNT